MTSKNGRFEQNLENHPLKFSNTSGYASMRSMRSMRGGFISRSLAFEMSDPVGIRFKLDQQN